MPPLICPFYQCLGFCNTIHITHFGMAVELHTFLGTGIHTAAAEVCDLFDAGNGTYCQLAVKTVNGGNAFKFQKSTFFDFCCYFRYLFIPQEHFDHNRICKICNRKDQDGFFITDLSGFHIHNLSPDDHLTHFSCYGR